MKNEVNLMLDSGAFSAFKKGESIDLKAYANYIKKHEHLLFSYVTLDVLPTVKAKGRNDAERLKHSETSRSDEAIEAAAEQSYRNHRALKKLGLHPIPVFHQGENFKWLKRMLDDGEEYIGASALKSMWNSGGTHTEWFAQVFDVVPKAVKVHGFGITAFRHLVRWPWYSVDSTTWSKGAGFGKIYLPQYQDEHSKPNWKYHKHVTVSNVERVEGAALGKSLRLDDPTVVGSWKWRNSRRGRVHVWATEKQGIERVLVEKFLREEVGTTLSAVRDSSHLRRKAIMVYFVRLCESLNIRLMCATTIANKAWGLLMNEVGAHDRLLSYYELHDLPDQQIIDFVTKGTIGAYQFPKRRWMSDQYRTTRRHLLEQRVIALQGEKDDAEIEIFEYPESGRVGASHH